MRTVQAQQSITILPKEDKNGLKIWQHSICTKKYSYTQFYTTNIITIITNFSSLGKDQRFGSGLQNNTVIIFKTQWPSHTPPNTLMSLQRRLNWSDAADLTYITTMTIIHWHYCVRYLWWWPVIRHWLIKSILISQIYHTLSTESQWEQNKNKHLNPYVLYSLQCVVSLTVHQWWNPWPSVMCKMHLQGEKGVKLLQNKTIPCSLLMALIFHNSAVWQNSWFYFCFWKFLQAIEIPTSHWSSYKTLKFP